VENLSSCFTVVLLTVVDKFIFRDDIKSEGTSSTKAIGCQSDLLKIG
jgi:hypothetical protein